LPDPSAAVVPEPASNDQYATRPFVGGAAWVAVAPVRTKAVTRARPSVRQRKTAGARR
jgi:hypothetical protein